MRTGIFSVFSTASLRSRSPRHYQGLSNTQKVNGNLVHSGNSTIISIILFANQDTMCVVPNSEMELMIKNMRQAMYTPVSTAVGD